MGNLGGNVFDVFGGSVEDDEQEEQLEQEENLDEEDGAEEESAVPASKKRR